MDDLKAQLEEAVQLLRGYERWESYLIEEDDAWHGGLPRMTPALYDSWMELQEKRNAFLEALTAKAR